MYLITQASGYRSDVRSCPTNAEERKHQASPHINALTKSSHSALELAQLFGANGKKTVTAEKS
jgi:hypothetical protein